MADGKAESIPLWMDALLILVTTLTAAIIIYQEFFEPISGTVTSKNYEPPPWATECDSAMEHCNIRHFGLGCYKVTFGARLIGSYACVSKTEFEEIKIGDYFSKED